MTGRKIWLEGLVWLILGAMCLTLGATVLWTGALLLWLAMVRYAVTRLRDRIFLAAFLLAFFIFLMSAESLRQLFDYRPMDYSTASGTHLSTAVLLGLSSIWLAYWGWPRLRSRLPDRIAHPLPRWTPRYGVVWVGRTALIGFWLCIPAAYFSVTREIQTVLAEGYSGSYLPPETDGVVDLVAGQLELMASVLLFVFLATFPSRRAALVPVAAWSVYLLLTVGTGQRGPLVLGALLLLCYVVARSREPGEGAWFGRRSRLVVLIGAPAAVVGLIVIESLRGVGGSASNRFFTTFVDFFYNQGVSASAIRNAYIYQDRIPEQPYLLEFLYSGWIARVAGLPVSSGNSVERATEQASFTHALSHVVLGDGYLAGRGTGSSFLAELHFSLGYVGIVAGSLLLGLLLWWVERLSRGEVLANTARLLIVQDLFWAPRGSATGFLTTLLAPSTIAAVVAVLVIAPVLARVGPRIHPRLQPWREQA